MQCCCQIYCKYDIIILMPFMYQSKLGVEQMQHHVSQYFSAKLITCHVHIVAGWLVKYLILVVSEGYMS